MSIASRLNVKWLCKAVTDKLYLRFNTTNRAYCACVNVAQIDTSSDIVQQESKAIDRKMPPYQILKRDDPLLSTAFVDVKHRKTRYSKSVIMLEGVKLIQDALNMDVKPKMIIFSRMEIIKKLKLPQYCYDKKKSIFYEVPYKCIQMWSDLSTSPGIIGIFDMPNLKNNKPLPEALPLTILCDTIREPGNLGSVLRIAAALPCAKVFLTTGCVDLWDTKVIRGTCGTHFKMPIVNNITWEQIEDELSGTVILADSSPCVKNDDDMTKECEEIAPSIKWKKSTKDELEHNSMKNIPITPYHAINYVELGPLVLIVGGETESLSNEAYKFAKERKGLRVHIPLSKYSESLNNATALGIIAFEIKRQQCIKKDVKIE